MEIVDIQIDVTFYQQGWYVDTKLNVNVATEHILWLSLASVTSSDCVVYIERKRDNPNQILDITCR